MTEQNSNNTATIVDAGRTALDRIRWALIEVYNAVGADAAKPQDVSRRFGLKEQKYAVPRNEFSRNRCGDHI
jgi:hypothetical protein